MTIGKKNKGVGVLCGETIVIVYLISKLELNFYPTLAKVGQVRHSIKKFLELPDSGKSIESHTSVAMPLFWIRQYPYKSHNFCVIDILAHNFLQ